VGVVESGGRLKKEKKRKEKETNQDEIPDY
jgi:hypothetical protein